MVERRRGLSVRLKLTLTYALVAVGTGLALLVVVWLFLLRYVPDGSLIHVDNGMPANWAPNRGDLVDAFGPRALQAMLLITLLGLIAGWFLAGRVLRPLDQISAAARDAAAGSLSHRIALPGRADELRDLADVFDTMLASLEKQVDEQRRFAANASHELRTPLAVTRTMLDVAAASPDLDVPALLHKLGEVNVRASESVDALLLLSRLDNHAVVLEPVDLSLVLEEALESEAPRAERTGVHLVTETAPAMADGNRALLTRLAINLLHNAIVHGGPGATVWVRTAVDTSGAGVLTVENTGAHVDPAVVATLTEPFTRGASRVRADSGHVGAGLGLAIVASIVRAHAGSLALAAREDGGLRVVATFTQPTTSTTTTA